MPYARMGLIAIHMADMKQIVATCVTLNKGEKETRISVEVTDLSKAISGAPGHSWKISFFEKDNPLWVRRFKSLDLASATKDNGGKEWTSAVLAEAFLKALEEEDDKTLRILTFNTCLSSKESTPLAPAARFIGRKIMFAEKRVRIVGKGEYMQDKAGNLIEFEWAHTTEWAVYDCESEEWRMPTKDEEEAAERAVQRDYVAVPKFDAANAAVADAADADNDNGASNDNQGQD